jgi:hypothetical protein
MDTNDSYKPALRASTACPNCGRRHVLNVHRVLEAKPLGSHSLSGNQLKVTAVAKTRATCSDCGASRDAQSVDWDALKGLPTGECGHLRVTDHVPGDGHRHQVCPGCCPACQQDKDHRKGLL